MDIYFLLWVIIFDSLFSCLHCSSSDSWELFQLASVSFDLLLSTWMFLFLSTSLLFHTTRCSRLMLCISCPGPAVRCFSKEEPCTFISIKPLLNQLLQTWKQFFNLCFSVLVSDQIRSVPQSCPTLCDPMNCSTPGLPVHHQLLEYTQAHVHRVSDAIQPSHPLSSPSLLAPNPSQHQSLFQWVNSSHEVAKVLEFQL